MNGSGGRPFSTHRPHHEHEQEFSNPNHNDQLLTTEVCPRVHTEIQGADPGVEASTGHTALTWAAVCGFDLVAAELLLGDSNNNNTKSGASVSGSVEDATNAVTRTTAVEGKTALHNAAFNGNSGVVVLLLDRLRDLLLRDRLVVSAGECVRTRS